MHLLNGQGATLTSALINKLKTMVLVPTKSHRNAWISTKAWNFVASQGFAIKNNEIVENTPMIPDNYVDGELIWNVTDEWPNDIILLTNGRDNAMLTDYSLKQRVKARLERQPWSTHR